MTSLTLASQSPDRSRLLSWLGIPFSVVVSDFDESSVVCNDPEELVAILAMEKAKTVAKHANEGLIIGADTVIVIDNQVMGKPKDINHAREMLTKMKNRPHQVHTGLAVISADTGENKVEVDTSTVEFKDFSQEELDNYLSTRESLGRAGSYQLLGSAKSLIADIEGSATGITGLPLKRVANILEEMGLPIDVDLEAIVTNKTGYRD